MKPLTTVLVTLVLLASTPFAAEQGPGDKLHQEILSAIRFHEGMLKGIRGPKTVSSIAIESHHRAQLAMARDILENGHPAEKLVVAITEVERKIDMAQQLLRNKESPEPKATVNESVMEEQIKALKVRLPALRRELAALRKTPKSPREKPGNGNTHDTSR